MNTPILKEIYFIKFDLNSIRAELLNYKIGKRPLYVNLEELQDEIAWEVIDNISIVFKESDMHPCFPYPFYAVTPIISDHPDIMVVPTLKDLPPHFLKREKKLKNKEKTLLNKSDIIAKRISNAELEERLSYLGLIKEKQKTLSLLAREGIFYEGLLKQYKIQENKDSESSEE